MKVLSGLPPQSDDRLLVDPSTWDDAGVARLDKGIALVQTVDFFPPVVDDPWWFGRIAGANALSDLYAMGAQPFSALNLVVFPTEKLPMEVLTEILAGGGDAVSEAGALLLGGHSVADEGLKYGLAVTGTLKPGEQITNAGARAGDLLYLTKKLGTGSLTTAGKKGKADEQQLDAACKQMGRLNKAAADAMRAVGVHAATDVTGYGLVGHGYEMANASGVDLVIDAKALPVLDGAREAIGRGMASGGAKRTMEHVGERFVADGVDEVERTLACDAETSGGLLIAVAADAASKLEAALAERDELVARVGEVAAADGDPAVRLVG